MLLSAQQSNTRYGNQTYYANGTTSTQYGNQTNYSNGVTATQYGNQTNYSNGVTATQYGNQTNYSNGVTATQYGNQTNYSNGKTCTAYGNMTSCNWGGNYCGIYHWYWMFFSMVDSYIHMFFCKHVGFLNCRCVIFPYRNITWNLSLV
jgi:hypothetical protein